MGKKVSAEIVFLLVVVPLIMYTCFLLLGIRFGRLLEREADITGAGVEIIMGAGGLHAWQQPRGGVIGVGPPAGGSDGRKPFYMRRARLQPRGVTSVGTWGGSGGQPFYMLGASAPRLRRIVLYHSGAIHSLAVDYTLAGDVEGPLLPRREAGPWGQPDSYGSIGVRTEIELASGEHITAVEGTTGQFADVVGVVITSLTFRTSSGRMYGPYGSVTVGSRYFSVPVKDGACVVGFWGRSGWLLDAIGVYIKPSCSSSLDNVAYSSASLDTVAYNKYAYRRQGPN